MKRRSFFKLCAAALAGAGITKLIEPYFPAWMRQTSAENHKLQHEARYYNKLDDNRVECELCFKNCVISEGSRGFCRNRENKDGTLYSVVYGRPSTVNVDPIEKEPMHHFHPDTQILCIGTAGCNFRCKFCQNWHLSQQSLEELDRYQNLEPERAVREAKTRGIPSISFTYNEPTTFYEYMYDIAEIAQQEDLNVIFHTNGALQEEPLRDLLQHIDAVTLDLKAFTDDFYQELSQARLEPVLDSIKIIREEGAWLELVNLVLPDYNDDPTEIQEMCRWIKDEVGEDTPLHFSRFFPSYQLTELSPTPVSTLEKAHEIARQEGLKYVSIGNVPGHLKNSTFCPECENEVIVRHHFSVQSINLTEGRCQNCQTEIAGVWHES